MTTEALPEYVYELGKVEPSDQLAKAINRLAQAIEQSTLARLDTPAPRPTQLAPLPAVMQATGVCPIHNQPWKHVPAGIAKSTGKPYEAFWACQERGCDQRPPR